MSQKIGKRGVKMQANWGIVLLSVAIIVGAVAACIWSIWFSPLEGVVKVLVAILIILIAVFLCFSAGMSLIF